ncbi:MAG: SPASM domain-containing protein [Nitrospinae bacterium]|nr:SPASM domain-containing protein [Nitrospinota bacterium]
MEEINNNRAVGLSDLNKEIFGSFYLAKSYIGGFIRDFRSFSYLLKHFKLKEFINFYYTKALVPTGEGSQKWFYHLGLSNLIQKFPDKAPLPRFFEIETTTVCNKKCFICEYLYWQKDAQVKRHLSLDEFKHIVNQFPDIRWINMTGEGSSFLNKDYTSMLKYLWEKHKTSIWLVDHLSDISFETLKKDVFPYVQGIYVSIDAATKKTYELIKIGCDYENVINNLKDIIKYKQTNRTPFPHLSFRYVILTENMHEMPLFLDLLNSIAKPNEWGGSSSIVEFAGLLYFPEIYSHYLSGIPLDILKELLKRKNGIEFRFSHAEERRNPPIECCIAWMEPYIMMPGYVLPCCSVLMSNKRPFLREYSFGNLFEKDFKEVWRGDYYAKFRKMVVDPCAPVPKICAGCRAYRTEHRIKEYGIWDITKEK